MITKIRSLSRFVTQKPNASLLLFLTTIAAIVLANSPLVDAYNSCLEYPLDFRFDNFIFFPHHGQPMSLTTFVNDAFMAIFFFVVGMEIKQELLVGELSSARKALLPVIAACGGMIVPVLVYMSVCHSGPAAHGAAIPMATDIAFALAALGALGSRVPLSLRVFLTALAVVDDIGGIIVIAIFYSGHVAATPLFLALGVLVFLTVGGRLGIQHALFFYTGFFVVWYLFTQAGIHPTIAGVLVAFTVPARPKVKLDSFADNMRDHLASLDFTQARHAGKSTVLSPGQVLVLTNIHRLAAHTVSPLQSLVERLNPVVNYLILPLFAFVNAGVSAHRVDLAGDHEAGPLRRFDPGRHRVHRVALHRQPLLCCRARHRRRTAQRSQAGHLCRVARLGHCRLFLLEAPVARTRLAPDRQPPTLRPAGR